ncbi:hypothetical protein QN277_021575 [Acacia crassicarpa]|uniref:PHD-type domain-containing protein n=2 Tax=Acacia crassicarpa TaxID=499986 RepID=A0AAE1MPJ8_9FABA|nr:hypothetical protein QN277_021575 [Acacia crassicarpa]
MREGLRSRKRFEKPETDEVSGIGGFQKKGSVIKQDVHDSSGVDSSNEREPLDLEAANKEVDKVAKECELDCDMGTGTNIGLVENENNGKVLNCVDNIETKVKKEGDSNDKLHIVGRVLRSQLKRDDGKKSIKEDNAVVVVRKSRESDESKKIQVKAQEVETHERVTSGYEEKKLKEGTGKQKLKRKRGRPPKTEMTMQVEETYECVSSGYEEKKIKEGTGKQKLKRKRGRPPKTEMTMQVGGFPRKPGRPPKAGQNHKLITVGCSKNRKLGFHKAKKSLTIREGACRSPTKLYSKRPFVKKLEVNFSHIKPENNVGASPLRSNSLNVPVAKKRKKNKAKQLVRDQIMEQLMAAGWTVDYRLRNGRDYSDAVYVSLDGRTHWSITLAYNRLKKHYENGDGEGKVYGPGFKFTPIPEEKFKTLTKVISKQRKDKKKSKEKGKKDGEKVSGANKKGKKGKKKRKESFIEQDHSDIASPRRMSIPFKDHKRQKTQNSKLEREVDSEVDGYVPYNGKRTLLAWMIDMGMVLQNGKVHYMSHVRKGVALEGRVTGDGIHCGCCDEIITISEFEAHAGSELSDPFRNIYTEGGISLLQCLLDSWNKQDESERKGFHFVDVAGEDPNDDTCGVCGDGGDLICCDSCPSTFHQSCVGMKKFPFGDWHCIYCCCKFCGLVRSASKRDGDADITEFATFTCHLCGQQYHRSCIEVDCAQIDDSFVAFCGNRCQELHERLNLLVGIKHEIEDGFAWTLIKRSDVGSDASKIKSQMVECNSKLAVAVSIMNECFKPYIDHRSGINMIHSILYNCGSNFNRLNYRGFFTAILERGDEIICTASIRIHGNQLAEMPFIGTRSMYRRQGMCRRLLNSIEDALSSLNVGLLVIPAVAEVRETWTSVFAFEPLDPTSKQMVKNLNLLVFPHVDMLQKKIPKPTSAEENLTPAEVSNPELPENICHELGSSGTEVIVSATDNPSSQSSGSEKGSQYLTKSDEIVTHRNGDEDSPCLSSENIPHRSEIVSCMRESKDSEIAYDNLKSVTPLEDNDGTLHPESLEFQLAESVFGSLKISNSCEPTSDHDFVRHHSVESKELLAVDLPVNCIKPSSVVSELNADEVCAAKTSSLQTDTNSGDCQSVQAASGSAEDILNGVNVNSELSSVAEFNLLPADKKLVLINNRWTDHPSELLDPGLKVERTAQCNGSSLRSPNTTGVALHCASAGGTEVIVLSNKAS